MIEFVTLGALTSSEDISARSVSRFVSVVVSLSPVRMKRFSQHVAALAAAGNMLPRGPYVAPAFGAAAVVASRETSQGDLLGTYRLPNAALTSIPTAASATRYARRLAKGRKPAPSARSAVTQRRNDGRKIALPAAVVSDSTATSEGGSNVILATVIFSKSGPPAPMFRYPESARRLAFDDAMPDANETTAQQWQADKAVAIRAPPSTPRAASGGASYTYADLRRDATSCAHQIRELVRPAPRAEASMSALPVSSSRRGGTVPTTVAIMLPPGYDFVVALLGTWLAGCVAVPLCYSHTAPELQHVLSDSLSCVCITNVAKEGFMRDISGGVGTEQPNSQKVAVVGVSPPSGVWTLMSSSGAATAAVATASAAGGLGFTAPHGRDPALIVYTSGTTAKPKGAVHTHASLSNQIAVLHEAWKWSSRDVTVNVLPLHHVHGLVNVLLSALAAGATNEFMTPAFDAPATLRRLHQGDVTLFMAVPTVYAKLCDALEAGSYTAGERQAWKQSVTRHVRLMVSGSSALPVPLLKRFEALSGHRLLERYGMTEIGMAFSQPVLPAVGRLPGTVGMPLPTVEAMIAVCVPAVTAGSEEMFIPLTGTASPGRYLSGREGARIPVVSGELLIRSGSMFKEYWRQPEQTAQSFVTVKGKKWFRTGDTVDFGVTLLPRRERSTLESAANDVNSVGDSWYATACWEHATTYKVLLDDCFLTGFSILGRSSVDILKISGYKVSALEIEAAMLESGLVQEVAVIGVPMAARASDMIVAVVVPKLLANSDTSKGTATASSVSCTDTASFVAQCRSAAESALAPYKRPHQYVVLDQGVPRNAMGKVNKKELAATIRATHGDQWNASSSSSEPAASATAGGDASLGRERAPPVVPHASTAAVPTATAASISTATVAKDEGGTLTSDARARQVARVLQWKRGGVGSVTSRRCGTASAMPSGFGVSALGVPQVGCTGEYPVSLGPWNGPLRATGGTPPFNCS